MVSEGVNRPRIPQPLDVPDEAYHCARSPRDSGGADIEEMGDAGKSSVEENTSVGGEAIVASVGVDREEGPSSLWLEEIAGAGSWVRCLLRREAWFLVNDVVTCGDLGDLRVCGKLTVVLGHLEKERCRALEKDWISSGLGSVEGSGRGPISPSVEGRSGPGWS